MNAFFVRIRSLMSVLRGYFYHADGIRACTVKHPVRHDACPRVSTLCAVAKHKLHLGIDLVRDMIICPDLTTDDVGDLTALSGLLDQIDSSVDTFVAVSADDGAPTRNLLMACFWANMEVIIPPPKTAVPSPQAVLNPSVRGRPKTPSEELR